VIYLVDALGSVRQLVDTTGAVTLEKSYQPYGSTLSSTGGGFTNYAFTGEWEDGSTGMIYLRARYYAPWQGRFLTRDTWRGDFNRPVSYNAWLYASSNPLRWVDPTGHNGGCQGQNVTGCQSIITPTPTLFPPGPPYRAAPNPTWPVVLNHPVILPCWVPTPAPGPKYETYYQGRIGDSSSDPGKYLYRVLVNGGSKTLTIKTIEGGDSATIWTAIYQASYEGKVYERGMQLKISENYQAFVNNPQASGAFFSLLAIPDTSGNIYFSLGKFWGKGSRTSGSFWIEDGNVHTWVTTKLHIVDNDGSAGQTRTYWFSQ